MFTQRNSYELIFIIIFPIFSILYPKIQQPDKPSSPMRIQSMDDERIHEFHQYIINHKSIFDQHEILMVHPEYYILLQEIIKTMDDIISYNKNQPVIDKKSLKAIGIKFEDLHFMNYLQLNKQIKDKIIQNKINTLKVK